MAMRRNPLQVLKEVFFFLYLFFWGGEDNGRGICEVIYGPVVLLTPLLVTV